MASLTLDSVDKFYGEHSRHPVHAVRGLDMAIEDGEIIGLLGSSGCGKTSTLRMIAGFESVSRGSIRLGERQVDGLRAAARNVAMAFEGYALYPPLKVRDNIAFSLLRDRTPRAEIERRVGEVAKLLEIGDILNRYPPNLSGGQQQRVSLARALVRKADLHLLDEPMSQLEPQLRAILRARIKEYLIEHRLTTVFVTHDQTEAMALADRIAVMEGGELQQLASPAELSDRPANLFVASFIGEPPMNLFEARVMAGGNGEGTGPRLQVVDEAGRPAFTLDLPAGQLDALACALLLPERPLFVGIRPHRLHIHQPGDTPRNAGDRLHISGEVVTSQWLGDQTHVGIQSGGCVMIAVSGSDVQAPLGSRVEASFSVEALHVFDHDSRRALLHGAVIGKSSPPSPPPFSK